MNLKLSIIILAHNSKEDLERLLPSIFKSDGVSFMGEKKKYAGEIIVVDNGSKDGTVRWLQLTGYGLQVIENRNTGFASGNNIGIKEAGGEYILILNPDTKLEKNTLGSTLDFIENRPDIGVVTCKVVLPSGKLDLACRRKFPNPWNSFSRLFGLSNTDYNMTDTDENISQEIDSCMGAFMMCRREALEKAQQHLHPLCSAASWRKNISPIKGEKKEDLIALDEDFFMYGEDIDLCWRVKEAGYKVWYFPKIFITHFKGSSSKRTPFKALKWFHDAMWIFYKKHYFTRYPRIFGYLVFTAVYFRLLFIWILNIFRVKKFVSKG